MFPQLLARGWDWYGSLVPLGARGELAIRPERLRLVVDEEALLDDDANPVSPPGWWAAVDRIGGRCAVVLVHRRDVDVGSPESGGQLRRVMGRSRAVWAVLPVVDHLVLTTEEGIALPKVKVTFSSIVDFDGSRPGELLLDFQTTQDKALLVARQWILNRRYDRAINLVENALSPESANPEGFWFGINKPLLLLLFVTWPWVDLSSEPLDALMFVAGRSTTVP